jgi:hypothetical protein
MADYANYVKTVRNITKVSSMPTRFGMSRGYQRCSGTRIGTTASKPARSAGRLRAPDGSRLQSRQAVDPKITIAGINTTTHEAEPVSSTQRNGRAASLKKAAYKLAM